VGARVHRIGSWSTILDMGLPNLLGRANGLVYDSGLSNLNDSGPLNECGSANQPRADSEDQSFQELLSALSEQEGRWRATRPLPSCGRRHGVGISAGLMKPSPAAMPWEGPCDGTRMMRWPHRFPYICRRSSSSEPKPREMPDLPASGVQRFWPGPEPNRAWLFHRLGIMESA
jgi:hypothetical protein